MFGRKENTVQVTDKEKYKLAVKYKKILDKAKTLPANSKEMLRAIRKAGLE